MTGLRLTAGQLLALNCYEEARNQSDDGIAAVARVVLNRMRAHGPQSDGTIEGTILYPNAFSWTQWEMVNGRYTRVVHTRGDMIARVNALYDRAVTFKKTWAKCAAIAAKVQAGTYTGDDYDRLGDRAVNYLNPDPKLVPRLPAWAAPGKLVCRIGDHAFYHA